MSFDLSQLRFTVETKQLDDAITKVGALATSVAALNKPLSKLGADSKTASKEIDTTTKAVDDNSTAVKKNQTILERQVAVLDNMNNGWSKGQSSVLAAGKAAGLTNNEMVKLQSTLASQRKIMGQDPFDQSTSGLISLTKELGQAREGYRQLLDYTKRYEVAKASGNGSEVSIMALSKKETDNLYRDKLRAFEIFKQQRVILKEDVAARLSASKLTTEAGNEELKAQKEKFREGLRATENHYKNIANIKRPLEDVRTVESTKKRDKLNYLARATSVQLGDIGISLAGGQNPLTVLLQQGDQLRAIFGDIGREGHDMNKVLNSAFTQIVTGFRDVALKLVDVVAIGFYKTAAGAASLAANLTGVPQLLRAVTEGFTLFGRSFNGLGADHGVIKFIKALTPALTALAATGVLILVATLATLAIAFKNILATSGELSNALILNGAALAITKKEAMDMSAALATGAATSLDVVKVITEVAQAGNIGKEALQGITTSAIDMNRYLGMSTKDVVKSYSELADDPVKALSEIGLATGRVNASTIERINGLVEEGEKTEAVSQANVELTRVYGEMSQKAMENMTPLGTLWDDMKQSVNLVIEEIYKFANTESVVSTLTAIWTGFANVIKSVLNLIKQTMVVFAAIDKFKGISDITSGASLAEREVATKELVQTVKGALLSDPFKPTEGIKKSIELQKDYVTVMENGKAVRLQVMTTELQAQKKERDAIKARLAAEKDAQKYGANSKLNDVERKKRIDSALEINRKNADAQRAGANPNLAGINQREQSNADSIRAHFKPKKESGGSGAAGVKDSYNAEIKKIQNAQADVERDTKLHVDKLNHMHKIGALSDIDQVNQVAEAEKESLNKRVDSLSDEKAIAARKKNSLAEIQKYEGDIAKTKDALAKREIDRIYAVTELHLAAGKKKIDSMFDEIAAISDLNKAYAKETKTGLLDNEERKVELDFRDSLIGKSAKQKEDMQLVFAEQTRLRKIDRKELEDLIKAREKYNDIVGDDPELRTMKRKSLATTEAGISSVASGARDNVRKETDVAAAELEFKLKITGLESVANVFENLSGIMGGFATSAQANLDEVSKKVGLMGSAYKAAGKEILKNAQDQAASAARAQKALGSVGSVIKKMSTEEKKGAEGSNERLQQQVGSYGDLAGAAKTYFEEGSAGYEVLAAAEQAFRAIELALSVAAMVQKGLETKSGIAYNLAAIPSLLAKAAAEFFANSTWLAFAGIAAMIAVMASFGGGGGGGGGGAPSEGALSTSGSYVGTGTEVSATGRISSGSGNRPSGTDAESPAMAAEFTAIEAAYQAAEAANKLADSLRTATEGMTQLETDLEAVKKATQGTGRAQHELATQGMSEAEIATYNYNASLRGQIMVLMDAANGTENASENMKDLANEAVKLAIDLKRAQGDIAGANRDQMMLDTKGFTADEVAAYDNNRRIKDEIAAIEDGAGAADNARQAEEDLARTRYELAARLDVLTGRKTQLEIDRHAELLGVTDEAVISLSKMIWVLEDLKSVVDKAFASIGRAVEAEKKSLAEAYQAALDLNKTATDAASTALTSATDLFNALKSTASVVEVGMTRDQAKVQLDAILSMQRMTGMLPTAASMSAMLKVLGENDEASFKTALDYKLDQAKSAAKLNELARAAGKQVSIEQLTLDQLKDEAELLKTAYEAEIKRLDEILTVAQAQLDKLNGIDTSIISVADAVKAFDKSLADLATAIAGTPANSTPDPVTGGSGGSGGGGSGSGASGADATPKFENIAGQENKDIVRAYREYYNRNPDDVGYKAFIDSKLTGDKLMQAILRASAANPEGEDYQMAVKRGYNPLEPMKKFLKSLESTGTGAAYQEPTNYAFATGINNVPFDMNARIHKGERILPAADNRELFARLQSPKEGNEVLVLALRDMSAELSKVKTELIQIKDSNKKMKDLAEKDDAIGTAPARAAL